MKRSIRNKYVLASFLLVFVALTPILMLLSMIERDVIHPIIGSYSHGYLNDPASLMGILWFAAPVSLFGEPAFTRGVFGWGPTGISGWLITLVFYTVLSICLWSITLLFRGKSNPNSGTANKSWLLTSHKQSNLIPFSLCSPPLHRISSKVGAVAFLKLRGNSNCPSDQEESKSPRGRILPKPVAW
jgi:hypothetical protein